MDAKFYGVVEPCHIVGVGDGWRARLYSRSEDGTMEHYVGEYLDNESAERIASAWSADYGRVLILLARSLVTPEERREYDERVAEDWRDQGG